MEVTTSNFETTLHEFEKEIAECLFVGIDTELSGLKTEDNKDNYFESMEERYENIRQSVSKFLVIQYGVVLVFFDKETENFKYKAYNFYTYPRQEGGRKAPNIRFLCETSSIDFLCNFGFDFNKLFYQGIRHLTLSGEKRLQDNMKKRQDYLQSEEGQAVLNVPEYLKKFMSDTEAMMKRFMASKKTEHTLDSLTPFQRKLIFHNIRPLYKDQVIMQTVNEENDPAEYAGSSSDSEVDGSPRLPGKPERPKLASPGFKSPRVKTGNVKNLKISKVSKQGIEEAEQKRKQKELDEIERAVGFSRIIRIISQSGKIVVGHNMLLDVAHTISQFVDELPATLSEFKEIVQGVFPNLVDTKVMASTFPFKEHIQSSVLADLLARLKKPPFNFSDMQGFEGFAYSLNDDRSHEAGFDALLTSLCFLNMCQYLGTLQSPKQDRVFPHSPLVLPFINKLYMMRMLDVTYINISGTDYTPSRSHVFHVTCPPNASQKQITDMFQPFGGAHVFWENDTSLFVALLEKDKASLVIPNLDLPEEGNFCVLPWEEWQERRPKRPASDRKSSPTTRQRMKRSKTENSHDCPKKDSPPPSTTSKAKELFPQPSAWD